MGKWISLLAIMMIMNQSINQQYNHGCSFETLINNGAKRITCTNVTSSFFQYSSINLNKSRWLICKNCNLSTITNDTFNFPKNNIDYLILFNNNIVSISNKAFEKMPLKQLNLRGNYLNHLNPGMFFNISRLLHLDLSTNLIESLTANVFFYLKNLDILNLNNNHVSYIDLNAFNGLVKLQYLYLNANKLTVLQNDVFQQLQDLKILYLENNCIKEIELLAFSNLKKLNFLYLNNNNLSSLGQYNFKPLGNLIDLQIRYNNLFEVDTSTFNGLKNVKYLYLGNNNLTNVKPYGFIGLNSLEVLELISNEFEYFALDYFKDMENLSILWLENNKISNFSVHYQSQVQLSLKVINLIENKLEFFNYKLLHQKVPQLEELWIGENPWLCDFIIEMCDYFRNNNVSVCTTNCSVSTIDFFKRSICFEPFQNETDFVTDFSTDCSIKNRINTSLLFGFFILSKFILSSTPL